jgi:hypothetical protein
MGKMRVRKIEVNRKDIEGTLGPILNAFDDEHLALYESRVAAGVPSREAAQQVLKLWFKHIGVELVD